MDILAYIAAKNAGASGGSAGDGSASELYDGALNLTEEQKTQAKENLGVTNELKWVKDADGTGATSKQATVENDVSGNTATGQYSHAEGLTNNATGTASHAEGGQNTVSGIAAHVEGTQNTASGSYSHAEGTKNTASGIAAHAEGRNSKATAQAAHAEGNYTEASGGNSHAEGQFSYASGVCSHAEGENSFARARSNHVEGIGNEADASQIALHMGGVYGVTSTATGKTISVQDKKNDGTYDGTPVSRVLGQYAEIVGNGNSDTDRSNARTLDWNGNEVLAGKLTVGAGPTADMDVATKKYVDENGGAAVAPDWNETNPESSSYIQNRPFYEEVTVEALLNNDSFEYSSTSEPQSSWNYSWLDSEEIKNNLIDRNAFLDYNRTDDRLIIIYDGNRYDLNATIVHSGSDADYYYGATLAQSGNNAGVDYDFSEYSFSLRINYYAEELIKNIYFNIPLEEDGNIHTLQILVPVAGTEVVHKIDEKYLPDTVATKQYVDSSRGDFVFTGDVKMMAYVREGTLLSGLANGLRETERNKNLIITYPILISTAAAAQNTTRHDFLMSGVIDLSKTNGATCGFTSYKVVYLKGIVDGITFTTDATTLFTQDFEDGYSYLLLGYAINENSIFLYPYHPVYKRIGNATIPYGGGTIGTSLTLGSTTITEAQLQALLATLS